MTSEKKKGEEREREGGGRDRERERHAFIPHFFSIHVINLSFTTYLLQSENA